MSPKDENSTSRGNTVTRQQNSTPKVGNMENPASSFQTSQGPSTDLHVQLTMKIDDERSEETRLHNSTQDIFS